VAEREPEAAASGFATPVLPPLHDSARRLQKNRSIPHPLLIAPGCNLALRFGSLNRR
jgi:hypothetical protein